MSARFGRNKRRAARERIEALEAQLTQVSRRLTAAERAIATAKEDGATAILRTKYLDQEIARISRYLSEAYGPKLMEAANRLMASSDRPHRPIDFRAVFDPMEDRFTTTTIEGFIPSLHYRVRVASI